MDEKQCDGSSGEKGVLDRRRKYILTAATYLGYMTMGVSVSINGSCLIDLAAGINSTVGSISWVFTGAAAGGIIGSFLVPIVARKYTLMVPVGIALLMNAIVYLLLPWCAHFELMLTIMVFFGGGKCFIDGSFTYLLVDVWKLENAPWVQAYHFMYGIGSMLAPLLAKPFITAGETVTTSTNDSIKMFADLEPSAFESTLDMNIDSIQDVEGTGISSSIEINSTQLLHQPVQPYNPDLYKVYVITACLLITSASVLIVVGIIYRSVWKIRSNRGKNEASFKKGDDNVPPMYRACLAVSLIFYCFAALLIEHSISLYLFTFAVQEANWSKDYAVLLMFVFLLCYTIGRGLCALLACCLKPLYILCITISLVLTSSIILCLGYHLHPAIIWGCSCGLGAGTGPFFAPAITFYNEYQPITPFIGGMTQVASAIAAIIAPSSMGVFYKQIGAICLVYILFVGTAMLVFFFVFLAIFRYKIKALTLAHQGATETEILDLKGKSEQI